MTTYDPTNDAENGRDGRRKHYDTTIEASFEFDGRIGEKMRLAMKLLAKHDYESKNQLAKSIGPNGSQQYGYKTINRLLKRNLITTDRDHPKATPNGHGAVVLTEKGERYLDYIGEEVSDR